ncbi:hypothetical protein ABK040_014628 [Willaertia magna]
MISHNNNGITSDNSSSLITTTTINNSNNNNNTFNNNKEEEIINKIKKWKLNKFEKYTCPISQELMIDPVTIESGHTFDRNSIEEWLKSKNTCPITRKKIKSRNLATNLSVKSTISDNIEIFIKKVIKNVNLWSSDVTLIDICLELINYSLNLIQNNNNFKSSEKEMYNLKFEVLLKEQNEDKLFNNYILEINKVTDLNDKIKLLQKLGNRLINENLLQKYFNELINLLIESKNNDNLLNEIFIKYCKLNNINNNIIDNLFNYLENNDNLILDYLIILFKSNYNKNYILKQLIDLNIEYYNYEYQNFITDEIVDKNKLIYLFKNLIFEENLKNINLKILFNLIKNENELKEEQILIYKELYKVNKDVTYLEKVYELNKNNKDLQNYLLNEYLNLNLIDKYLNLQIKLDNNINSFNIVTINLLQKLNNKMELQKTEIENQKTEIENQNKKIENQNIEIIKLKQLIEDSNNSQQKNDLNYQQIINNFKIKYPEYDYVNIINIEIPLNVEKYERFFSDEFEVFGLKWKIEIYPKGSSKSKENECGIFLHLNSLQYKNENEEEKEISSIKMKCLIDSINLNDNDNYEVNFTKIGGYGYSTFKQSNFIPIIKNDKQIFSVVIGMKKLDIQFKTSEEVDDLMEEFIDDHLHHNK